MFMIVQISVMYFGMLQIVVHISDGTMSHSDVNLERTTQSAS